MVKILSQNQKSKIKNQKYKSKFKIFNFGLSVFCILIFAFWISLFAQETSKEEEALFIAKKAFQDGFYEVSLGLLERFLKNYPNSPKIPQAHLLIGQGYFHQNRFLDALTKFEDILSKPELAKDIKDALLYWIAEVHFKGNDFGKAAQYYKKVIDEFPKSSYLVTSYYSLGWCLFEESLFQEALEYFKIVEEKFPYQQPQVQDASFKIIECLYNLKDYKGLKEKLNSYLKSYSKDTVHIPYLYFYLAEADYYLENFDKAIEGYLKATSSTDDERIKDLCKLGMAWSYLKLKQYPKAQDIFSELPPKNLEKRNCEILLLGKAILSFETNRLAEAKNIYNELLNKTADPVVLMQAYIGKADALYNMAEYKGAIDVYTEALDRKLQDAIPGEIIDKLHYGLAWCFLKEGQFKEAINEFQKIARRTEDKIVKISALCQIGDAYQDSGNYGKAIETYDSILKDYPGSFYSDYVQYQLGITLLKNLNYNGAIMSFLSLKRNLPNSKLLDDATYSLGLAYFQREDYALSKEVFQDFINEFKDSNLRQDAMYLLGTSLYNRGEFAEAIEVFKNIIRTYNQNTELVCKAEYEIADCFYQMGNEKEAMARFKMLRSKYPDSSLAPEVMWWLGEYYYRQRNLILARRYFSSLIQDFPQSNLVIDSYYALGSSYEEESKYPEAINNFKKVIELTESDLAGQAAIAIADIYVKQQNFDVALATYKDVVGKHANLTHLIYPKVADIYYKIGSYDNALDFYSKSLEAVPIREMSFIQFKIAEVLETQKKIQDAIAQYLKVTYLYSENNDLAVKALLRIAAIYEDRKSFKEAVNIYKRIISMEVEEAKYAQERIDWIKKHKE